MTLPMSASLRSRWYRSAMTSRWRAGWSIAARSASTFGAESLPPTHWAGCSPPARWRRTCAGLGPTRAGRLRSTRAIGASLPSGREGEFAAVFEAMTSYHPQEPHWYLPLIGVDPARHRKGYGAALLQDTLRRCDQDYVAAYLESTNPANITLYQRHGFELRGTIQVGSAPPLFPMLRPAR